MKKKPTIECKPNGPYLVKDLAGFKNSSGEPIPCKPVMALCRCGGSANKPFCDGTHLQNGFADVKLSDGSNNKRDDYRGKKITIHDNRGICSHAGRCTDGLAAVFKYGQEPWIDPNGAQVEEIIKVIKKCPSGALSYSVDEIEQRDQPREAMLTVSPAISISKNGPYEIVGGVELVGQVWGQDASTEHYTLCRCGASKNKPFCDGSHWAINFKSG